MKEIMVKVEIKINIDVDDTLEDIGETLGSIEENFNDFMGHCPYNNTSIKTTWDYIQKE
jgi:hypothetical protein